MNESDAAVPAAATTVSGLSAGGYMAIQAHIALSDRIAGVASLAAGPYHCAEGNLGNALGRCMRQGGVDVDRLASVVRTRAEGGDIAPTRHLDDARIWLFHSPTDAVISTDVARSAHDLYKQIAPAADIAFVNDVEVAHGWPTLDAGRACDDQGGDFINACNYDAAGALLKHLYGPLAAPAASAPAVREVDVSALLPEGSGVADIALAYVPTSCAADARKCRLHIAFHGCRQSSEFISDRFASSAGLNRWAATNNIAVLYPQVARSPLNPQGCWDWWGYTGAGYDQRSGPQIAAVAAFIDGFASGDLF